MDTIVLSFFYKGQMLHVLESGKVVTNSGDEAPGMTVKITEGISGAGDFAFMMEIFDNGQKIAYKATVA